VLKKASELVGLPVHATDGDIGSITKILFDDERWTVRYVVVDTGKWLPGRQVLISPISIRRTRSAGGAVDVSLTRQQVKDSPDIDTDRPVSRQQEMKYHTYYGYPYYWGGVGLWGTVAYPWALAEDSTENRVLAAELARDVNQHADTHLRDSTVVRGYHIKASDGEVGHVDDFLLDDESWRIQYLIVDTSNWLGGRHVLVSPDWVTSVRWDESRVHVALTRDAVKNSPDYDSLTAPNREYEQELYTHYGRVVYWHDERSSGDTRRSDDSVRAPQRANLARLEDLTGFEVANAEPDVRGWKVVASDGVPVGSVEHLIVDRSDMKALYLEVDIAQSGTARSSSDVLIPLQQVDLDRGTAEVRLRTLRADEIIELPRFTGLPLDAAYEARLQAAFDAPSS
jgi:sporulation protein YlmC with PRC-barrel domain